MKSRLDRALDPIIQERVHQEMKWGPTAHEYGAWLALMAGHFNRAMALYTNEGDTEASRDELRQALALGVACAEQHGLPPRVRRGGGGLASPESQEDAR